MSSVVILKCDPHPRDEWKNYTNLKNLQHLYKDVQDGNFVFVRLKNINQQVTFAPILKVQGFAKGYEDYIYVYHKVWGDLGGQNTRVRIESPGNLAWLKAYFLRFKYDDNFKKKTIPGFISVTVGALSMLVPTFPPWNYILGIILLGTGLISLWRDE